MDFVVNEFQLPVVKVNYEQLEAELQKRLTDYKGLVVTDDTLAACKDAQKELAGLRIKIDTFRKEKKQELSKPITEFEAQCKKLIADIEEVEMPLKDGIKVFDDAKREAKRADANIMIADVAEAIGLNEKYAAQLTVLDKYLNLTASKKSVKEDLETRAFALKVEQDREQERITIIMNVINTENGRLRTKLSMSEFQYYIDNGMDTSRIIDKVREHAERIFAAENRKPDEITDEEILNELHGEDKVKESVPEEVKSVQEPEKIYTLTVQLTGTLEQIRKVSAKIKEVGLAYNVTEKKEV